MGALKNACFRLSYIVIASVVSLVTACSLSVAQSGLTVFPTKIVFEGRQRSAEVTLFNNTSIPATYRISFKNMRMLEDGAYQDIDTAEGGELFADQIIRFSPRQAHLEPGKSQTVRLQLRKPADLATGEYRSHLLFQSIPSETAGEDIEKVLYEEGELSIKIVMVYGVTIPVIVRHGDLSASVTISNLEIKPSVDTSASEVLFMRLNRSGNKSVSGEIVVTFKPEQGDDEQVVGLVNRLNILSPSPARTVKIPMKSPEGVTLQDGRLHIVYRASPEEGGEVLATAELRIP